MLTKIKGAKRAEGNGIVADLLDVDYAFGKGAVKTLGKKMDLDTAPVLGEHADQESTPTFETIRRQEGKGLLGR